MNEKIVCLRYSSSLGAMVASVNFKTKYSHKIFVYEPLLKLVVNHIRIVALFNEKKYGVILHEIGIIKDHVHIVFQFGPNIKLAKCISLFKQRSGYYAFKKFPWLKGKDKMNILGKGVNQKLFCKGVFWSGAYYFDSVGEDFDRKCDYARKQDSNEKNRRLSDYFVDSTMALA
ncbi:MAG: transposase [Nanoarchaeota archaeon]